MPSSRHSPPEGGGADDAHLIEQGQGGVLLHRGFFEMHRDTVRLPDGSTATREYIRHPGAVAVVPLLDSGADPQVVLVRQYRYPISKVLLEWPAGKLELGEDQLACAMRELQEETGYSAAEWAYGGEIHNAAAYSSESIWIWYARGLVAGATRPDEGEFIETVQMALSQLQQQADAGTLPDVKTQVGLAWLQRVLGGQRSLQWQPAPSESSKASEASTASTASAAAKP